MKASKIAGPIGLSLMAIVLFATSAGVAWANVEDYQARGIVSKGVSIAGKDLGGMDEAQARAAIEAVVAEPLLGTISVETSGQILSFSPATAVSVDVEGMLTEAYAPRRGAPLAMRLRHDLLGEPLPAAVEPKYTVDEKAIRAWVADAASKIDTKPVDASYAIEHYELSVTPSSAGVSVDQTATVRAIVGALSAQNALSGEGRTVSMPLVSTVAAKTEKDFGKLIVVSLSQRRIRFYDEGALVKTYPCAIGQRGFPTPTGDFKIVDKRYMPSWTNTGSDWAAGMPPHIGPGVNNPLGTRALYLNAPGIRMHGIPASENSSIGRAASHGCIRMFRHDVEEFYELVPIGTPVFIRK